MLSVKYRLAKKIPLKHDCCKRAASAYSYYKLVWPWCSQNLQNTQPQTFTATEMLHIAVPILSQRSTKETV